MKENNIVFAEFRGKPTKKRPEWQHYIDWMPIKDLVKMAYPKAECVSGGECYMLFLNLNDDGSPWFEYGSAAQCWQRALVWMYCKQNGIKEIEYQEHGSHE